MTAQQTGRKSIVFVTTADTDILTADRSVSTLNLAEFTKVLAYNPVALENDKARDELLLSIEDAGVVVLRLLGGKQSMPFVFDSVVERCHSHGIPLIACPGHQEWDEDLVTACSVPVAELETVFAYLMRGGVQNFQNLN